MNNIEILIVEDELLIAENLALKLKKFGYTVIDIVSSGKAALKSIESAKPDLILMDISIKGKIDGITTATEIRAEQEIPIIFLTAYADDETLDRAANSGCYGYIIKPFKDRELHATIKMALKKHQEQIKIQNSLEATIAEYSAIHDSLQATISEYSTKNHNIHIDSLTNLPNRLFLRDVFEYFLSQDKLTSTSGDRDYLAVIYFSLDRFERISNSLGINSGDLLIKMVAEELTQCMANFSKDIESAIIRLQNDEFAVLLSKIKHKKIAGDCANFILENLRKPFVLNKSEVFLTASMGISFYDRENLEIELLLEQAQQAMKYARQQGGNKYKLYTLALNTMVSVSSADISLETDLHYALERQELELYYQPIINLKTGKISGTEALIRWNHPKLGLVSPNKFITIAENNSLIRPIGEWVLQVACRQTKNWHQAGFDFLTVAVNLSGHQFKQLDLFHSLTQILFDSGLESRFLELEFTEKMLVDNIKANIQRLNLIKKIDIKIVLDDFGTGYSSLAYLQQFPFDTIKIDRCFVHELNHKSTNAIIVKNIIEMAHELGLKVVAEGIETQPELALLQQYQCDEVQGYLLSHPLTPKEFSKLLVSDRCFLASDTSVLLKN